MMITVSGLDGSGKSTLLQSLRTTLAREGRRVTVLHFMTYVGLDAYARYIRNRLFGVRAKPWELDEQTKEIRHKSLMHRIRGAILWNKALRVILYPIDLVLFLGYRFYVETLRGRVLIMDRYFYDRLVDIANDRNWGILRFLERLTPTPDLAILLDVPPEQAYARKREQPFSYLERRWRAYKVVFPWIATGVLLENHDIRATEARLYGLVQRCLGLNMNTPRNLVRALLDDSREGWSGPVEGDVGSVLRLAKANGVLLRTARRLGRRRGDLPAEFELLVASEEHRAGEMLQLIKRLAALCTARGVPHVFLTTLDGYPDVGRDVDLLVLREASDRDPKWLEPLGVRRLPSQLGDRLAAAARYQTEGGEVDVHLGRLGRVGEDEAFARSVINRRRLTRVGEVEFFAVSPTDALVLQSMRRMYSRRGVRVSDILATVRAVRRADFEWPEVFATAQRFGVLEALSCYLGYLEQMHQELFSMPLLPVKVAPFVEGSRWGRVGSRHSTRPFPTRPVSAGLYLRKLGATVASRRWEAAGRLCLIPVLGATSAVWSGL